MESCALGPPKKELSTGYGPVESVVLAVVKAVILVVVGACEEVSP